MEKQELQELSSAFDAVFDAEGQIKNCGRAVCMHLISLMKRHSSEDVGDEKTGMINIETMKSEYLKLRG